jgi:hypothetical protein
MCTIRTLQFDHNFELFPQCLGIIDIILIIECSLVRKFGNAALGYSNFAIYGRILSSMPTY